MEKIIAKINLSKINKDKIVSRTYTNKEGKEITEKNYEIEIVPLFNKERHKVLWENDESILKKKYFVVEGQTKEERSNNVKTPILGDGLVFESKTLTEENRGQLEAARDAHNKKIDDFNEEIDPDSIPF